MRVVFMGTPEFSLPALDGLLAEGYDVVAVYTQPDRPAGRSRAPVPSPVKRVAQVWHLPVVQPVSFRDPAAVSQLADFQPDVIVVAAFGQILPQAVLDIPRFRCINVHASLLPKLRGAAPIPAAILAGDEFAGVSIMLIEKKLDAGPVLSRAQISISSLDTYGLLSEKLSVVGARLLIDVLVRWFRGEIVPRLQNDAEATFTSSISKKAGEIDWHLPAREIWRRVRAFSPWPGAYTTWQGKRLKLITSAPLSLGDCSAAGKVLALPLSPEYPGMAFGVCTGEGVLGVIEVQLEGKSAVTSAEFARGQRQFIGVVLPS